MLAMSCYYDVVGPRLIQELYLEAKRAFRADPPPQTCSVGRSVQKNREKICSIFKSYGINMTPSPNSTHYDWSGYLVAETPFPGFEVTYFDSQIGEIVESALFKKKLN